MNTPAEIAEAAALGVGALPAPGYAAYDAALRAVNADRTQRSAAVDVGSESMGRFEFDGAENIAFWIGDSDYGPTVRVEFDELPTLAAFLRHNLPGLFAIEHDGTLHAATIAELNDRAEDDEDDAEGYTYRRRAAAWIEDDPNAFWEEFGAPLIDDIERKFQTEGEQA